MLPAQAHLRALRHQRQPVDVRLLHDVDRIVHRGPLNHLHQHLNHVLTPAGGGGRGTEAAARITGQGKAAYMQRQIAGGACTARGAPEISGCTEH